VAERTLAVLDGSTFVVGDRGGDLVPGDLREHGFFSEDTRFVSRWALTLDEATPELLSAHQREHFSAQFVLVPPADPEVETPLSVLRRRLVDRVWLEEVTVINHRHGPTRVALALHVDADFADLFEVKDGDVAARGIVREHGPRRLRFVYTRGSFERSLVVEASREIPTSDDGFAIVLDLEPHEEWTVTFTVTPHAAQSGVRFPARTARRDFDALQAERHDELTAWLEQAPVLESDDRELQRTYRASLADLAALRFYPDPASRESLPAAGLPWFMTLFGRDSIITSLQALPFLPQLAATTLRVLAARQAHGYDDFHEQEPGKILHEIRFGELTAFGQRPHSPYYGSADATPLFLVLLDEYHRWTGDDTLVRELEIPARAALGWIDDFGDLDGDGYVEYSRRNLDTGLVNQCWKDSWNAIAFADGRLASGPIATCEIQGYVYDARRRMARLARDVWRDADLAAALETQATELRAGFNADFWLADAGHHALALDGEKRPVDSLTSNIGHLLWSGIVDEVHGARTAQHLMGDALNSGWGVRTMSALATAYNPLGYHTGTIWPHDNALIAAGLARYGHREAAGSIASALLAAAPHFDHRLPEVFAGYPAALTGVPVRYPTASRPQAWAAGAPLQLLTLMLDVQPGQATAAGTLPGGRGQAELRFVSPAPRPAAGTATGAG
jgi:glycogen debranching enzyme